MKMNNKRDNSIYFVVLVIILFVVYWIFYIYYINPRRVSKYFTNYSIIDGKIKELVINDWGKRNLSEYSYFINDIKYTGELNFSFPCRNSDAKNTESRNEILGFNYPVAVSKIDPTHSILLIRPKDFELINEPFPDSMTYIYEKYFKCTWWESIYADD